MRPSSRARAMVSLSSSSAAEAEASRATSAMGAVANIDLVSGAGVSRKAGLAGVRRLRLAMGTSVWHGLGRVGAQG